MGGILDLFVFLVVWFLGFVLVLVFLLFAYSSDYENRFSTLRKYECNHEIPQIICLVYIMCFPFFLPPLRWWIIQHKSVKTWIGTVST